MSFGTSLLRGLEDVGKVALKVGEVAAPIATQVFAPQLASTVQNLVAQAEQKFPAIPTLTQDGATATASTIKTGPQKFDWVKTVILAAEPFLQAFLAQHGITFNAAYADAAIEAAVTAYKADLAAYQAIEALLKPATPMVAKAAA